MREVKIRSNIIFSIYEVGIFRTTGCDIRIKLAIGDTSLAFLGIDQDVKDLWCLGSGSDLFRDVGVDSSMRNGWNRAIIAGVDLI